MCSIGIWHRQKQRMTWLGGFGVLALKKRCSFRYENVVGSLPRYVLLSPSLQAKLKNPRILLYEKVGRNLFSAIVRFSERVITI